MTERTIALIPAYNEATRVAAVVTKARPLVSEVVVIDGKVVFKPRMKTLLRDFADER